MDTQQDLKRNCISGLHCGVPGFLLRETIFELTLKRVHGKTSMRPRRQAGVLRPAGRCSRAVFCNLLAFAQHQWNHGAAAELLPSYRDGIPGLLNVNGKEPEAQ